MAYRERAASNGQHFQAEGVSVHPAWPSQCGGLLGKKLCGKRHGIGFTKRLSVELNVPLVKAYPDRVFLCKSPYPLHDGAVKDEIVLVEGMVYRLITALFRLVMVGSPHLIDARTVLGSGRRWRRQPCTGTVRTVSADALQSIGPER